MVDKRTKEYKYQNNKVILVCLSCGKRFIGYDQPDNTCPRNCLGPGVQTEIVVDISLKPTSNYITK
jgi:hypothetical protein